MNPGAPRRYPKARRNPGPWEPALKRVWGQDPHMIAIRTQHLAAGGQPTTSEAIVLLHLAGLDLVDGMLSAIRIPTGWLPR